MTATVPPENCQCAIVRLGRQSFRSVRVLRPGDPIPAGAVRGCCSGNRCSPVLPADPSGHARLCSDCGYVTTRRDRDGLHRCLGSLPEFKSCSECGGPLNPVITSGVHPCCVPEDARFLVISRELDALGMGHCTCAALGDRDCPCCKEWARRVGS